MLGPALITATLMALLVAPAPSARAQDPPEACARADGRVPVLQPWQQSQARRLLAPWTVGQPLAATSDAPAGWTLTALALEPGALRLDLTGPTETLILRLRPAACAPDTPGNSASFHFTTASPARSPEAEAVLRLVQARATAQDPGNFFSTWVLPEPTPEQLAAATADIADHGRPGLFDLPLHRSTTGIAFVLLIWLLFLLADLRPLARDLGLVGPDAARTLALLAALLALAYALRAAAGPTWLREAHPFLAIPPQLDAPILGQPIDHYPQGPQLLFHALTALLPSSLLGDPFDAWHRINLLLGTLTVAFAFVLGAALPTRAPARVGLLAAALCASWPQHIRVSASESVHTALALTATAALATALVAARTGRLRTFVACAAAASATALMRPEGALWLPAIAVVALAAGPGVRTRLLSPPRLLAVAVLAWLTLPTVLGIGDTASAARLAPGSGSAESVGSLGPGQLLSLLIRPDDGRNAFFDWTNTPVWLWPLALWGAAITLRRGPASARGLVVGLLVALLGYLTLYANMGPAGVVWTMARYQLAAFPAVLALTTLGTWDALSRLPRLASPGRIVAAGATLAALGCAAWWPAMSYPQTDWRDEVDFAIDLGRQQPPLIGPHARLVTPDNRRRFLDMAPRDMARPLTAGRQGPSSVVTIEHALSDLHVGTDRPEAFFYRGLYCHLAVAPRPGGPGSDEAESPQCAAMAQAFELSPVATRVLTGPAYLQGYAATRAPGPLTIGLYRVGARRLAPEDALKLLPAPVERDHGEARLPMGSGSMPQREAPHPPLR